MIQVKNLRYAYPDGKQALNGVSFSAQPGEKIALIGPNGAGKSTLLLHLNGILRGDGEIRVNGNEMSDKNLKTIRSLVGLVFQNPDDQLFSLTVYDDVGYGPIYQGYKKPDVETKVKNALKVVGLEGFEERNPFHLSGGEKKRASIATVLSMEPKILALDEPTAGLDPRARREIIELLGSFSQTIIVATHDLDMVSRFAQKTILISEGRIVAQDKTEKILCDAGLLMANGLA